MFAKSIHHYVDGVHPRLLSTQWIFVHAIAMIHDDDNWIAEVIEAGIWDI
jgi:hypothetical protein